MDATRRLSRGLLFVLFLVLLVSATNAVAEPTTFFGEDSGLGEEDRLTRTPNADAARADFITQLSNPGTEKFESFAEGAETPLAVDFGAAGTATLQGTGYINEIATGAVKGRYPISGDKYWDSGGSFYIDFSKPEAAFGFYGVDVGDFHGQLTIAYEDGSAQTVTIPHTVDSPGGTVIYFGFIDLDKPFTKITFGNTAEGAEHEDVFGFDDFTIGTREQVELTPTPTPATTLIPTTTPATTQSTTPEISDKGDCNGDDKITAADALCALQMAVGKRAEDMVMDVNGDGKVSSLDAMKILRVAAGLEVLP